MSLFVKTNMKACLIHSVAYLIIKHAELFQSCWVFFVHFFCAQQKEGPEKHI